MDQKTYNDQTKPKPAVLPAFEKYTTASRMTNRYLADLSLAPGLIKLITQDGKLEPGSVKSASDFSYSAPTYAGEGYRIVGDAGGASHYKCRSLLIYDVY